MAEFNPNKHTIKLKRTSRKQVNGLWTDVTSEQDYLPVQGRLLWLHSERPKKVKFEVVSEDIRPDYEVTKKVKDFGNWVEKTVKGWAKITMRVSIITAEDVELVAEASKTETAADFPDYVEKAQTGAIGRALLWLGYGTAFAADELDEGERIVDAPVEAKPGPVAVAPNSGLITTQQKGNIVGMSRRLGKQVPDNIDTLTAVEAQTILEDLRLQIQPGKKAS